MTIGRPGAVCAIALAGLALAGCDPCSGLSICEDPRLDGTGLVISHLEREPVAGVVVRFEPGPGQIPADTIEAVSDPEGRFLLRGRAPADAPVSGRIVFIPPPPYHAFPYAIEAELRPSRIAGGGAQLGTWGVGPLPGPPRIDYAVELRFGDTGEPAGGVSARVVLVGGDPFEPTELAAESGTDGRFYIRPTVEGSGTSVVDVELTPPAGYTPCSIRGVELPTFEAQESRVIGRWALPAGDGESVERACEELPLG